jgi:hypothetical protein
LTSIAGFFHAAIGVRLFFSMVLRRDEKLLSCWQVLRDIPWRPASLCVVRMRLYGSIHPLKNPALFPIFVRKTPEKLPPSRIK